ncbi:MAG: helix-turn-helix domain-containing protein [Akkermansia sp.]|nr:helix-turn-helix domain-containing protein [Akkermansia sp.]
MNFLEKFPAQLSAAMKAAGYSQLALANATGIKQSAISTYCKGKGLPNVESLYLLAQELKVSMEFLLTGENNQNSDITPPMSGADQARELEEKLQAMKKVVPLISMANAILSEKF